jgi:hypothetical protein
METASESWGRHHNMNIHAYIDWALLDEYFFWRWNDLRAQMKKNCIDYFECPHRLIASAFTSSLGTFPSLSVLVISGSINCSDETSVMLKISYQFQRIRLLTCLNRLSPSSLISPSCHTKFHNSCSNNRFPRSPVLPPFALGNTLTTKSRSIQHKWTEFSSDLHDYITCCEVSPTYTPKNKK